MERQLELPEEKLVRLLRSEIKREAKTSLRDYFYDIVSARRN